MKNLKSISLALLAPVVLSFCFSMNVIKHVPSRSPAVEADMTKVFRVKANVYNTNIFASK